MTGGRGVIEGLGKQLALSDKLLEPSFASLFWYGNTSSASVWYALGFIEAARSLACGDIVWQVCTLWHIHICHLDLLGCWQGCVHAYTEF